MVVMMVMVVVTYRKIFIIFNATNRRITTLIFSFRFNSGMPYTVLGKFLAYLFLYRNQIACCYNVHRCITVLTVQTPNVNMMNITIRMS